MSDIIKYPSIGAGQLGVVWSFDIQVSVSDIIKYPSIGVRGRVVVWSFYIQVHVSDVMTYWHGKVWNCVVFLHLCECV